MLRKYDPRDACSILQTIAAGHGKETNEYLTLELGAWALLFIHANNLGHDFTQYLEHCEPDLNPEKERFLRSIGLHRE